jgi:chromate reductase, NAD(P)H dehydrogenase (quinone)
LRFIAAKLILIGIYSSGARNMTRILAISGSLRANSFNTAILRAIVGLAPKNIEISLYNKLGDLPHFNPEINGDRPLAVIQDWRARLKQSDGVIICTPEYAHGIPGVLKNALDWIVSSGEFMHKPTAVIGASPSPDGGNKARDSLVQTLAVMMAEIVEGATLLIPSISAKVNERGEVIDPLTSHALKALLANLVRAIDNP